MLWLDLYKSCVSETNPDKLEKLVCQTEDAIFMRSQELSTEHRLSEEVRALKAAAQKLFKLKTEKLGWPDPYKVGTNAQGPTRISSRNDSSMKDLVLKYPIWQQPYRAAVIESNPKLLKQKIATAAQAVNSRFKELENSADHHHERMALTDALAALKILAETTWAE